jgi:hypothetical protein
MALDLAAYMKRMRMNVGCAWEFAQDLVWEGREGCIDDQLYVFGNQFHRVYRLYGQTEYIISDSPFILSCHYARQSQKKMGGADLEWLKKLDDLALHSFNQFNNIVFEVERGDRAFVQAGRVQDEATSKVMDKQIHNMMRGFDIPMVTVRTLQEVTAHLGI